MVVRGPGPQRARGSVVNIKKRHIPSEHTHASQLCAQGLPVLRAAFFPVFVMKTRTTGGGPAAVRSISDAFKQQKKSNSVARAMTPGGKGQLIVTHKKATGCGAYSLELQI